MGLQSEKRQLKRKLLHEVIANGLDKAKRVGYTKQYDIETSIMVEIEKFFNLSFKKKINH